MQRPYAGAQPIELQVFAIVDSKFLLSEDEVNPVWVITRKPVSGLNSKELLRIGSGDFGGLRIAQLMRANQGKNETTVGWLWGQLALEINSTFFSNNEEQGYVASASFSVLTDRKFTYTQIRKSVKLDLAALPNP